MVTVDLAVWLIAVGLLVIAAACVALIIAAIVETVSEWLAERRGREVGAEADEFFRSLRDAT